MKTRLLLFFVSVFFLNIVNSQEYFAPNSTWTEYRLNIMNSPYIISKTQYYIGNDTTIQSVQYKQIINKDSNIGYIGAIREDGGKVYARFKYYGDQTGEFLLYDFSVKTGDVIYSNALEGALSYAEGLTVINVAEIVLENGESRKRISFDGTEDWIEGIGSIGGLFSDAVFHATNYTYSSLTCFKQADEIIYVNNETNLDGKACDNYSGTNAYSSYAEETNSSIIVSNKILQIDFLLDNENLPLSINIFDTMGICHESFSINNYSKMEIDMSIYNSGTYFISINYKKRQEFHKIMLF